MIKEYEDTVTKIVLEMRVYFTMHFNLSHIISTMKSRKQNKRKEHKKAQTL